MGVRGSFLKRAASLLLALPLAAAEPVRPEVVPAAADRVSPRLLWIAGHSELSLEGGGPDSVTDLRKTLEAAFPGQKIEAVHLASIAAAPKDAVLILAGPKRDLSEAEATKLRDLLAGGARLLACLDPATEHGKVELARLRAVLKEVGAEVRADRIVDREAALPSTPPPATGPAREERAVFVARYSPSEHAILAALPQGTRIVFSDACRVAAMSSGSDPFDARELAATSPSAYAVSAAGARGPAGPVLVAATRRAGPGRYVVAGDATFLTNGFAERTGLRDAALAIAAIRWLAEGLEAPPPARAETAARSSVTDEDRQPIVLIAAVAVAALLVAGTAVFARRN